MKLTRRFLALLLAFSMSLSMVTPAFASEVETVAETEAVVEEIAAVEAEAADEAAEGTTEASTEGSDETTEASDETTEGSTEEATEETEPVGSEANPEYVEFVMNDEYTEGTVTVTVPANTTYYFQSYGIGGMVLSINGVEYGTLSGNPRVPAVFTVTNETDAEAEFILTVSYAVGSQMNPAVLSDGETDVSVEAATQGYYFNYVAADDGIVTIQIAAAEGMGWTYVINNLTSYLYGDNQWSDSDPVVNPAEVTVTAGDQLEIIVNTYDPADMWNAPAGDLTLNVSFEVAGVSEQNPRNVTFEMNDAYSEGAATVTVPANTTYYFQAYGVGGMVLSINGVEYGTLSGNPRVPAIFTVTNDTDAEAAFILSVSYPAGSQMNPAELVEGETVVSVEAGTQGYYFTYVAADRGVLTFEIAAAEGMGWTYVINNLTSGQYGDTQWNDSDPVVNPAEISVNKGDELSIVVNTYDPADMWNAPAGDLTVTASLEVAVGAESNPVDVTFEMNEDYSAGSATVSVPANTTYYFCSYGVGGMMLSINGVESGILSGNPRVPAVFPVSNETDTDADFVLTVSYPDGSQMNPAELTDGETIVTLAEGTQGYFFTYTAADRGVVNMTIAADAGWTYVVNNMTSYIYGDTQWSDSDPVANPAEISVNKGDELQIIVNTYDAENPWAAPAGDITLTVSFEAALGSESNPIYPDWEMDENNVIDYTVTVPANTTNYYCAYGIGGMLLTINDGEPVELVAAGMGRVPVIFTVTNDTDAEAEYALHLEYPIGNTMNPAELSVYTEGEYNDEGAGLNIATVKEGDWYGYNYTWIAPADGELTITMSNGKAGWFYVVNNMTAFAYGDNHYSCNGDSASETIAVSAGDEIAIVVNSCGADEYGMTPAGDVYFNANYTKTVGIESNPYMVEFVMNDAWTEGTATVTVPANTTYYCQAYSVGGMVLTVDGVEAGVLSGNPRVPAVFTVTNETDAEAEFVLFVSYPAGSQMKPAELSDGETTVTLAEGTQGYYFSYTAADRGVVTFEIAAAEGMGWTYVINNMTTYSYGDTQWSDSDPVVNPAEISVNKGDELQIIVNTYDAANPWAAPAGDVTVNVSFAPAEGTESLPVLMMFTMNEEYTEGTATVTVPANSTYYFQSYGIGGMILSVNDVETETLPASMGRMPVTFSVTNDTYEDAEFALSVKYPVGSMMNPKEMILAQKTTAEIEEGCEGYFFTWTATGNGVLEFTMNTKTGWTYQLSNDNTYASTDTHWSDEEKVVKKEYLAVNKGDVVTIMVNTYDPENPWSAPAGNIEFNTKLIVSYNSTLLAGKNVALKYLDPKTGKAISNSKITWAMDEQYAAYATLKNGTLTAAKTVDQHQQVIVTATYEGVEQRFVVDIYPAATSVTIKNNGEVVDSKTTLTLITNKPETWPVLTAVVESELALSDVIWTSSSTKVATVEDGVITPVGNKGNVTITATAADGSGKKATVKIAVTTEVTSIDITSKTGFNTVGAGKALTLIATTNKNAVNQKVEWSISDGAEYATIKAGKLTANKGLTEMHEVTVVATAMDGSGVTGTFTATVLPIASSVVITDAPATVDLGGWPYAYLGAEVLDAEGNVISYDVTWKSSSDKIATVNEYGTVEFLKAGNVTITATANDGSGKKATVKITGVKAPVEVQLPSRAVVAAGKSLNLSGAIVLEADATNKKLTWAFDDPETAAALGVKVNNGKVSTNAKLITEPVELSLTATAVLGDAWGWHASDTVIVMIYPATTSVSIMGTNGAVGKSVDLKSGDSMILYAETAPANAAGKYSWTSSNESIATVEQNPDGSVTLKAHALKNGKATITATAVDGTNKKASFTVNVTVNAEAIEMDRQYVVAGKSIDLSKQIRFLDYDGCSITPVSKNIQWSLWVRSLIVDENGEPVLSPEGWPSYEWNPAENNKCEAGTLDAKTGKFTANKVTDYNVVIINVEYVNDAGETIGFYQGVPVEIFPAAAKGVEVYGCDGEYDEYNFMKLDKQNVTTTENQVILNPMITNWEDMACWSFDVTTDNDAFAVTFEEMKIQYHNENGELEEGFSWFYVLRPVDEANPYGTVKVTIKTVDGSNKSTYCTVNFVAP